MRKFEKKALIIGISNYNSELPNLEFCARDGRDLNELLKSQGYVIPDENFLIGQVNYDKIRDTVLNFFTDKNIKPTDTLLFYFSGHGLPDEYGNNYLAASDIDPDMPLRRGFTFEDLKSIAERSISKRIVTILDCCYAGAVVRDGKGSNSSVHAKLAREAMDKFIPGRCVLASSQAYQESYGLNEPNNSLFTYYLLKGLEGANGESVDNDGNVTAGKLADFIYDTIMSLPPENRPRQQPVAKIEQGGNSIILANYPELSKPEPQPGAHEMSTADHRPKGVSKKRPLSFVTNHKLLAPLLAAIIVSILAYIFFTGSLFHLNSTFTKTSPNVTMSIGGISLSYPSEWQKLQNGNGSTSFGLSLGTLSSRKPMVVIGQNNSVGNLEEYANSRVFFNNSTHPFSEQVLQKQICLSHSGKQYYNLTYMYPENAGMVKVMEIGTVPHYNSSNLLGNTGYYIQYSALGKDYFKYLPTVLHMIEINSFRHGCNRI